ncbi:hypothetical protein PG997_015382 [Apiospora hydei]|uniref:NACHT domain-containing protein n=1 Tax=Apiospora hydei TaxID=1337664 RepID=A0ABR1USY9_9PEZI
MDSKTALVALTMNSRTAIAASKMGFKTTIAASVPNSRRAIAARAGILIHAESWRRSGVVASISRPIKAVHWSLQALVDSSGKLTRGGLVPRIGSRTEGRDIACRVGFHRNRGGLLDLAYKIGSAGWSLYNSRNETPDELRQIGHVVADIREKNLALQQIRVDEKRNLREDELAATRLANECVKIATELEKVLDKLKIRDGHSKTLEVTRVVIYQRLRRNEVAENQSATMAEIEVLSRSKDELAINLSSRFEDIQDDILRLSEKSADLDTQAAQLRSLVTKLESFQRERSNWQKKIGVIESLHFEDIKRRWSNIEEADKFTNSWLFDESQTSFLAWLKGGSGMFWIGGKAGSGKSTLMKFASKHDDTRQALRQWAGSSQLNTANFFFWNQGYEMQKSKTGLIQSLLYQVLSKAPDLIPQICYDHPAHEQWDFNDLTAAFQSITERHDMPAKFCFFIDGLDEYGGSDEDLSQTIPGGKFQQKKYSLAIEHFTKGDMETHVRHTLGQNEKFQLLGNSDALLKEMIAAISKHAQGVWLWVFLVTRDLVKAVNHDESSKKLQEIIETFPKDLESYFENVINRIEPHYRQEMAKIFLITLEEVQPLPLYAFSLLERERRNPHYAIKAPMAAITESELSSIETPWKSRIINRCGDLLTVTPGPHPTFLHNSVDFLHRTVRDFLQDCYLPKLKSELGALEYSPLLSLCNMTLFLLKKLDRNDLSDRKLREKSIRRTIGLVDELLYYAHEYEAVEGGSDLVPILDEVDRVNCVHAGKLRNHWTHARDLPSRRGLDEYDEGDNYNFLALTVQARLVGYVREKLQTDRKRMKKDGRPLLDYALRPRRVTALKMPYHSARADPSVDVRMIRLLLEFGASPNQDVHLNRRTVWALFLLSMYETKNRDEDNYDLTTAWYAACELLVLHGASLDCWLEVQVIHRNRDMIASDIITKAMAAILKTGTSPWWRSRTKNTTKAARTTEEKARTRPLSGLVAFDDSGSRNVVPDSVSYPRRLVSSSLTSALVGLPAMDASLV